MRKVILLLVLLPLASIFARTDASASNDRLLLATTTSLYDSGLLEVLIPPFEKLFNLKVDVVSVGTGKAFRLARNGDVDILLVHNPTAERRFIKSGYGINRREVMYNDFVIVGPPTDPAGIKGSEDITEALKRIIRSGSTFISRGDESGTHKKEKELWAKAGVDPASGRYMETGQGMGLTLRIADEKRGYTLVDRGTYLAFRDKIGLVVVYEKDPLLLNPYSVIAVNPARYPHVNYVLAMAFIGWITSPEAQKIIGGYRRADENLFHPSAIKEQPARK
ncbi:MAG TPA: tungsten ABC transporter substrate-binding protein [Candidatus Latescibacteria bacterium]|nr:tungsten ABC transporter substrate-binding protein [Candidatus Latescibacterota bacterium]